MPPVEFELNAPPVALYPPEDFKSASDDDSDDRKTLDVFHVVYETCWCRGQSIVARDIASVSGRKCDPILLLFGSLRFCCNFRLKYRQNYEAFKPFEMMTTARC